MKIILIIYIFFATMKIAAASPENFSQSKKIANTLFEENPITLYCGCRYDPDSRQINLKSCGMESASDIPRANRLEWEHMMPAENFGKHLECWREKVCQRKGKSYKGRACCEHSSAEFRSMEAELYNLWPSVGLVNGARSNYRYSELSGATYDKIFYGCPFIIDTSLRRVEPRDEAKGIGARANLFMAQKYNIKLSDVQRRLFEVWNKKYPPSEREKTWAKEVGSVEGYSNPFIVSLLKEVVKKEILN